MFFFFGFGSLHGSIRRLFFYGRAVCFKPSNPWPEVNGSLLHVILYRCEALHALILGDAC